MIYSSIVQDDITTANVDVIVNAANAQLKRGGGVDGAIHHRAGPLLQQTLNKYHPIQAGELVVTEGFELSCKYLFHAVGPRWYHDTNPIELLKKTYKTIFTTFVDMKLQSIAIPNISTGVYGFPKDLAASIVKEITDECFAKAEEDYTITFYCFDDENYQLYLSYFPQITN